MNSQIKILSDGQLAIAEAAIYTAPATTPAVVKMINFQNRSTTTNRVVEVFRKKSGGTSRRVYKFTIPPEGSAVIQSDWTMDAADEVRAFADAASEVDYTVNGYQFPNT